MSAGWWRRWVGLPLVVALFYATSVVAAPPQVSGPVPAPTALQVAIVSAPQAMGQRPDLRIVDQSGHDRTATDPTAFAWLRSERAGARTVAWWHLRCDTTGHRAQTSQETYQGRGPPGRRAADVLS
jgi:hypothetical protein